MPNNVKPMDLLQMDIHRRVNEFMQLSKGHKSISEFGLEEYAIFSIILA